MPLFPYTALSDGILKPRWRVFTLCVKTSGILLLGGGGGGGGGDDGYSHDC